MLPSNITVVAWDFDGVLNHNVFDGRFVWIDDFERATGFPPEPFIAEVFGRDLNALMTGREDLRDRVQIWADKVGFQRGPDWLLDYWFTSDARSDPKMLAYMDHLSERGIRQVMVTNNDPRRTAFIEKDMGFGERVEHIFAAGRMGIAKPDEGFYGAVTDTLGVEPAEIMMFDDLLENVEAAHRSGWQGLHFTAEVRGRIWEMLPHR